MIITAGMVGTIEGYPAKDASRIGNAHVLTMPTGRLCSLPAKRIRGYFRSATMRRLEVSFGLGHESCRTNFSVNIRSSSR